MNKKYVLMLTAEEREELEAIANKGADKAVRRRRARALLLTDQSEAGPAMVRTTNAPLTSSAAAMYRGGV